MSVELDKRLREVERILDTLLSTETGIPIANDNVAGIPTDAELDTAFGDAATLYNGFVGLLDDNGAGTTVYVCYVVNDAWFYEALTKAT